MIFHSGRLRLNGTLYCRPSELPSCLHYFFLHWQIIDQDQSDQKERHTGGFVPYQRPEIISGKSYCKTKDQGKGKTKENFLIAYDLPEETTQSCSSNNFYSK